MKKCIVMRGVPGSGKSYEAARICKDAADQGKTSKIHSTDNYHMVYEVGSEPKYVFNPDKLAEYHRMNQQAARQSMKAGVDVVVIDNTNVTAKEIYPYVEAAFDCDYDVEFVEARSPWWLSARTTLKGKRTDDKLRPHAKVFAERNQHGVPEHAIMKMLGRFQMDLTLDDILASGRN